MIGRVLWLTETYPPQRGGMAESCDRIVYGLRRAGVFVDVVHLCRRATRPRNEHQQNGLLMTHPIGDDAAHALATLWSRIEHGGPFSHIVAFGGALPLLCGPSYSAWLGAPLLVLLRGNEFDVGLFSPGRAEPLLRALATAARVCVVSRETGRKVAALCPAARISWAPNGIDLERFSPLLSQRAQAQVLRGQAGGRRVLGLFGQLKRKKGILELCEALLDAGQARRFHLLCTGELAPELVALLDGQRDELSATIEPPVERYDLLARYPACDLVALPSLYDGMPNVLLEAAALSVPFLASTAGAMGDLLCDGEHGFLFHPGDDDGRRRAIARAAAAEAGALRRMGAACRALVERDLTASAETARYLLVLHDTMRIEIHHELDPPAALSSPLGLQLAGGAGAGTAACAGTTGAGRTAAAGAAADGRGDLGHARDPGD